VLMDCPPDLANLPASPILKATVDVENEHEVDADMCMNMSFVDT